MSKTRTDVLSARVKALFLDQGFVDVGITRATSLDAYIPAFQKWLEKGYNAGMSYMARNAEKRVDPELLVTGAKSVVLGLMNYFPETVQGEELPQVAKYAYGRDYHKVLKKKLKNILKVLEDDFGCKGRAFVDSAPVMEKPLGELAGLGWIGKNGCLISPRHGSFFVMGELVLDCDLEYDEPAVMACGTCSKCIDACPTKAIVAPGVINSERCLSYLTIEKKERELTELDHLHNRVFGCDICQDVCPWNRKSKATSEPDFAPKNQLLNMTYDRWRAFDESLFEEAFAGTPIFRSGFYGIERNLNNLKGVK